MTAAAIVLGASHAAAQQFVPIPPLPGHTQTVIRAVSGDGSTAVGTSGASPNERAFYWTEATGVVELPFTGSNSQAWDLNYDGSVIVGQTDFQGVRWVDGVMEALDGNKDYPTFIPRAVSDDGTILGGRAFPPAGPFSIAARWTENGLTDLGELMPDTFPLIVTDISNDGSTIVGLSEPEAFRWTEATGMVGLGFLPGFMDFSTAECVSGDGNVVGGQANIEFEDGYVAVYWDATGAITQIPSIIPSASVADSVTAMNDDGSILVGRNTGFDPPARELFLWNQDDGPRELQDAMESTFGVDFLGWDLAGLPSPFNNEGDVFDMSNTGHELVGVTINPNNDQRWGWLIRLNHADLNLDGAVNVFDLFDLLASWGTDGAGADLAEPTDVVDVFDLFALLAEWG